MEDTATQERPATVKFGQGRTQYMPIDWAENLLILLKERHAKVFGTLLAEVAMNGDERH